MNILKALESNRNLTNKVYKKYKIEKDFYYKNYRCLIIAQDSGFRCGYIKIPKNNILYNKKYQNIDINIHGGLTYSSFNYKGYPIKTKNKTYWIGFDCHHADDLYDLNLINSNSELYDIAKNLNDIMTTFNSSATLKDKNYIENELKLAVNQIIKLNNEV